MTSDRNSQARLTLFIPGIPRSIEEWNSKLAHLGLRFADDALRGRDSLSPTYVTWVPNDGAFARALAHGTVPEEANERIDAAPGAIVLDLPLDLMTGGVHVVELVRALRDAGALAVRIEQSQLGWLVDDWITLFEAADPRERYEGAVLHLTEERVLQSCGMHAFSLPDVRIEVDGDPGAAEHFAGALNLYQLAEAPLLLTGHTFRPDADTPRRVLVRWPDLEYPSDHPCHNPYGVWRCETSSVIAPQAEAMVFMPSLHATLVAVARGSASPLHRAQVLAVRDKAPCMAMHHADARKLEWSRGYADLEPELVWEQWSALTQG